MAEFGTVVTAGELTLGQLETKYASLVYSLTGSYKEAAQQLDCAWRTLKSKIDQETLDNFRRAIAAQKTRQY